ncbi:MAG: family 43 glycosylhydrolase [Lachnospiraceae bacterium]|nr:family 43 glycosylhydrolase [Lachnospiraceae bacterium]
MNLNLLQALNPYLPSYEYIPDGEPYIFNNRVYVYGSHDKYGGDVYCELDYVCWSASVQDLGNWTYEGVIYRKDQDPLNGDLEGNLYAPDVTVGPDGRYYLYYALSNVSRISVAVCDEPAGKYEFYGYVHYKDGTALGEKAGDEQQFDPGVLTEDGKTYLYTGFCPAFVKEKHGAMVTVLGEDMLTIIKEPEFIVPSEYYSYKTGYEGHAFFEAPSIRKNGEWYYFIYSSVVNHELCYAMGKSPEGPFEYSGVIISNCDIGIGTYKPKDFPTVPYANNHGSIVRIGEDWYIFYHRHTNGHNYSRQGCFEKLKLQEDGKIMQAELTSGGAGPLKGSGIYPAYIACNMYLEKDINKASINVFDVSSDRYMLIPWIGWIEDDFPKIIQDHSDISPEEYLRIHKSENADENGEEDTEINSYISNIRDSAVLGFKYFDIRNIKGIAIRTKGYGNGSIEIYASEKDRPECRRHLGGIPVASCNVYRRNEIKVNLKDGIYALYFIYRGDSNLNLLDFELVI